MEDKGLNVNKETLAKPVSRKIKLFKGLSKIAGDAITQNWLSVPGDVGNMIKDLKLDDQPGLVGWKLVCRSLTDAVINLIVENNAYLIKEDIVTDDLDTKLNALLEQEDLFLGLDFFKTPGKLPFLESFKPHLVNFLQNCSFQALEAANITQRLNSYFVFALEKEWRRNYKYYQELKGYLETPFNEAVQEESRWYHNTIWLNKQVDEPIFSESFGLRQIYIPLRAYYTIKEKNDSSQSERPVEDITENNKQNRVVTDLEKELLEWYDKADKNNALRIIRGGPGYGKSSFMKMFAAKLSSMGHKVLFIPLHRFALKDDLIKGVQTFLEYDEFAPTNPFKEEKLLILFDGLDEYSMQGQVLADVARQFIEEVKSQINNFNNQKAKLLVIISGRDVVVQQNEAGFRKEKQVLRLLPYYVEEDEREKYSDSKNLLKQDQRDQWWRNYGKLKRLEYEGLPKVLASKDLDEITAQPLLNYLVALSLERGKIDFSKTTNLNEIYQDLLNSVFKRQYEEDRVHASVKDFKFDGFQRILEEIAVSTWHGDSRTTTVKDIEDHFQEGPVKKLLDDFLKEAEKGVLCLLAAFYFRKAGHDTRGTATFEFTHKSFGEYLTARRIINKVWQIHKKVQKREADYDEGWDIVQSLTEWARLFGPRELDPDLVKFIKNEIQKEFLEHPDKVKAIQQTIIKLIDRVQQSGMPMEKLTPHPSFHVENLRAINAERALLVILGIIANFTEVVSKITWPTPTSFGEWLSRLQGQRTGPVTLLYQFLNHLDLSHSILYIKDLLNTNLEGCNLSETKLYYATLWKSNLRKADLRKANLRRANLEGADLGEADLRKTDLWEADLRGAILVGAILVGANLEGADFSGANLVGANFSGANLRGADLEGADFSGANLVGADFSIAKLRGTKLWKANLRDANLREAILEGADFSRAKNIDSARFRGAHNIDKAIGLEIKEKKSD